MSYADKSKISIISGKAEGSINDLWITLADNWINTLLNRDFNSVVSTYKYLNMRTRNDFQTVYDGVRKFALDYTPVTEVTSVIENPDDDSPTTMTVDDDYFVNLSEGTIEFADGIDLVLGQRTYKINYKYGYTSVPDIIKDYANYWAAFTLESQPAVGSSGNILREVEIGRYREAYATASTALQSKYSILPKLEEIIINKYKIWD